MTNRLASWAFTLAALATAFGAAAQNTEQIKNDLRKKYPDAPIETVRKIPYGNLFEVVGGGEVFYTDDKTTFLLIGSLIDTKTKENVTEVRMRQVNAVKFDSLPLESAIKIVRGNGSRRMAVFEDPNCGYCKRFERDLTTLNDITVYVFLFPILSPSSTELAKAVWCSPDRQKAWLDYMIRDTQPAAASTCENPIDKIVAFGREKRITGTPTLFFEDGERIPGAVPVAQIEQRLVDAKKAIASAK
ncbi:DsbC family protein [Usitatibacter palustris]|uniref:Thiol:disulfide interchange protein n=1 Tax=Usitatibacter palustris TaxID=2732487 RepID=A0A6M4H3N7_9PROT|nr:DsbC family protein [Usitatibacter palustris]QJR13688.1 putative thiol:disulfide interchange protein DsbC [Usitatibacter palustris]